MVKYIKDDAYSFEHCVQRYKERYNKILIKKNYDLLNNKIKKWLIDNDNSFKIISKYKIDKTNYSYILEYFFDNEYVYITYDSSKKYITTFLPPSSIHNYKKN